mmetsp:Transcript_101995/g.259283  ORF Transcript_101995/g.259283 Transcript_101995/m.259283 type:complete len:128 (+) Transcript_101995:393-776(+)
MRPACHIVAEALRMLSNYSQGVSSVRVVHAVLSDPWWPEVAGCRAPRATIEQHLHEGHREVHHHKEVGRFRAITVLGAAGATLQNVTPENVTLDTGKLRSLIGHALLNTEDILTATFPASRTRRRVG